MLSNGYLVRKLNDSMGEYVANQIISSMIERNIEIKKSKILILGITFKENCPDIRNTKVVDLINSLKLFVSEVDIYDPWANPKEVEFEYGINIEKTLNQQKKYDCITLAVPHNEFKNLNISKLKNQNSFVYDIKGFLGDKSDKRL